MMLIGLMQELVTVEEVGETDCQPSTSLTNQPGKVGGKIGQAEILPATFNLIPSSDRHGWLSIIS